MDSILLVSSSEKSVTFFLESLEGQGLEPSVAPTAEAARGLLLRKDFDLCLINVPLDGGGGERLAREVVGLGLIQVLLLVGEADFPAVSARCDPLGIFTMARPLGKKSLRSALRFALIARDRLAHIRADNAQLRGELQETRLVDRAKCILIQYLNMSETQAHRYIEKQAMDMRISRLNVAENILKTYES